MTRLKRITEIRKDGAIGKDDWREERMAVEMRNELPGLLDSRPINELITR